MNTNSSHSNQSFPWSPSRRRILRLGLWAGFGMLTACQNRQQSSLLPPPDLASLAAQLGVNLSPLSFRTVTVNEQGKQTNAERGEVFGFTEDLGNSQQLQMIYIPGGEFLMGSPPSEPDRIEDEGPQHLVSVPPFFMGQFSVTKTQYELITKNTPQLQNANHPVDKIIWDEAMTCCEQLSTLSGRNYALPSEAQWEYACRAGTTTAYHYGPTLPSNLANAHSDRQGTTPVGRFPANAFGLHDMHGNVWEWCLDHGHEDYNGAPVDGSAWIDNGDSDVRMLRGGSWISPTRYARSAHRTASQASEASRGSGFHGFRVVCNPA